VGPASQTTIAAVKRPIARDRTLDRTRSNRDWQGAGRPATKRGMPSFDIVSRVDLQEVDNAVNQTRKEVAQRYDLKDSKSEIGWDQKEITITSADDFKVKAVVDVLQSKLAKRNVPIKNLEYGIVEAALGGRARQKIKVLQGLETEKAREIVKFIKASGIKVQSQINDDEVRVTGKKRDDLQDVIAKLRGADLGIALQYVNFRD
jgi:cyclic-di-GMP-binding protein